MSARLAILAWLTLAPALAADDPPPATLRVMLVDGLQLTPLEGIALVELGPVELAAEAVDPLGLQLALRPRWQPDASLAGRLAIDAQARTCRVIRPPAGDAVATIVLSAARQPGWRREVPVWGESAPPVSQAPRQLAAYLRRPGQLVPLGGRPLLARAGQRAQLVVLGRYADGRWRAAAVMPPRDPAGELSARRAGRAGYRLSWRPARGPLVSRRLELVAARGGARLTLRLTRLR